MDERNILSNKINTKYMSKIFIVGGGTSLKDFDYSLLKKHDTITINHSLFSVPDPNFWITMDYSWVEKIRITDKKETYLLTNACKIFVANLSTDSGLLYRDNHYIWKNKQIYDLNDIDITIKSFFKRNFGALNHFAHGQNSGFCALQLALCLGYTQIYLLGIDLCTVNGRTHYHELYDTKFQSFEDNLQRYYENFYFSLRDYKGKSKIYSCSKISRLNDLIQYKNIKEVL